MANINQGHNDRSRDPDDCILWTTSGVAPGMQAQDIVSGPMVSGSLTGEKSSFDIALITSRTLGMDKEDMVSGAPPLQFVFETQDTTQGQAAAEDRSCPLDAEMAVGQFSEPFEIEIKDTYGIFQAVGAVYAASPYTAIAADLTRLYDINSLELPPSMEGRGYMTGFGLLSAQRYFPTRVRLLHFGIPERNIQAIAMTEVRILLALTLVSHQAHFDALLVPPQVFHLVRGQGLKGLHLDVVRGLAILTVLKAGFLGSGRFGSGLVVARLPDGSWSAPSAIATVGGGFGGQIGFELTDFVFILNDANAVKTFAQAGSLTLGGNVSLAAGPVGRNAEAAGAASLRSVAGIFSYSKTKGLFAGVSLEGSGIIERRDANEKLYGTRYTAQQILSGGVAPPPQSQALMAILNGRAFSGLGRSGSVAGNDPIVAGIFSYSKTKGLFAGVSLEGSGIIERRDANEKLYGTRYTAQQILSGGVAPPPQSQALMTILNGRAFSGLGRSGSVAGNDPMYNDSPVYDNNHDDVVWNGRRGDAMGEGMSRRESQYGDSQRDDGFGGPKRSSTWQDDVYDRPSGGGGGGFGGVSRSNTFASRRDDDDGVFSNSRTNSGYGESRTGPGRPTAAKPNFAPKPAQLRQNEAVAVFTFDADQPGDLGFKKGEVITVTKKTDSANDWWTGQIGGRTGIFPSNYVKMKE
ncbi:hypothetical protein BN1723_007276 [Verticillium longisporum]|uniref:SH3 domain-containing protein n=1 Tax=Verticillium longisporum TaxID=100787 RepID=A0A0G4NK81_VERLO|nr:hypothetical protein BN1723_007276 [Verticillium longisporum]